MSVSPWSATAPLSPSVDGLTVLQNETFTLGSGARALPGEHGEEILPGQQAGEQADAGAGVAAVDRLRRLGQPPRPLAGDLQPLGALVDRDAHGLHGAHGVETILPAAVAGDDGLAVGQRAQDDRAMGDGLVARHGDRAPQGPACLYREMGHVAV